ncbi:hypothetical protein MARBORIA2_14370 [Methanobrevibacter arboriphilus]|uniref:Uncharacterized protein n=1 Tax=Methanobrevibacter arboriphilus TaxID=39441 RepID=A0ACA8R2T5_METAZ|nr:right-handed parallel beta-helix repeat-containing protein [Methanobrevibacter arboriphilus]BBL61564.1 hypothetical protein MarbSA_06040 [Methanobrevibacter arboriphilus]GLI12347.1 hypothetical protein MARBORIA2_14370 [Methanobrevibacter arboriphilus]
MIKNGDDQIKNIKLRLMFLLVLFVAIGTMTSSVSAAQTWNIDNNADLSAIQSIIDNAGVGDIISFATDGAYNLAGSINISKTLTILGNGATITGIQDANTPIFKLAINTSDPDVFKDISISNFTLNAMSAITVTNGANITLDNLTLTGANKNNGTGITASQVRDLTIKNVNASNFRDAIGVGGGNNTVVTNNDFHDLGRNAMSFYQNAGNIFVKNNTMNNAQYGVFFGGGVKYIEIEGNNISNMSIVGLAIIKSCNNAIIKNNNIIENNIGIIIKANDTQHGAPTTLESIIVSGNNISKSYLFGILLENIIQSTVGKELILDNNTFSENGWRYAEYVGGDWWNSTSDQPSTGKSGWGNEIGNFDVFMNYFEDTTPTPNANLTLTDTISTNVVKNGGKLIYTLTVKNIGNGTSDVITIDTGLLSSIANSVVTYKSTGAFSNNKWIINSLKGGDTASLVLEVQTKKSGTKNIISTLKTSTQNDTSTNPTKLTVNKDIKVSSSNAFSANKVKRNKYFYITTTIKNTGLDNSSTFNSKIATTKGLKVAAVSKSSYASYNKKSQTWTVKKVPAKKTITLKMKVKATKTGTQKVKVTTNGKSQTKSVKVVK